MEITSPAGTDLQHGHSCSKIAYKWAEKSFCNRSGKAGEIVPLRGSSFSNIVAFGDTQIGITSDGIGTKMEIAERVGVYNTLGYDLVAMVADDLVCNGLEPTSLSNILDADHLDPRVVDQLMEGLYSAANFARISVVGGEIAELGNRTGGFGPGMHSNWCATGIGFLPKGQRPITGDRINPGDAVILLKNPGMRSNGFSLARKILENALGANWHDGEFADGKTWGQALLTPSLIYCPVIVDMLRSGVAVHGISHITGGGIPDNLGRILRYNQHGASIHDPFPPEKMFLELQRLGKIPDYEAYHSWNMSNGMLLIVPPTAVEQTRTFLGKLNYESRLAGEITEKPGIEIQSRGRFPQRLFFEKTGK